MKTNRLFSFLGVAAGVLGILIVTIAQLLAFIDDSYTFGNIWFLGIVGSIIGIIGACIINKSKTMAMLLIIVSIVLGIISISYFYVLPFIIQLICILLIIIKK